MRLQIGLILTAILMVGCEFKGSPADGTPMPNRTESGQPIWKLRAHSMRVYPSSRFKIDKGQAIIDAKIELTDDMGDSVKSVGQFHFDLYAGGKPGHPANDERLYAWTVPLLTLADQQRHWDSITRTYTFRLKLDKPIDAGQYTSLSASFNSAEGKRLGASAVLTVETE